MLKRSKASQNLVGQAAIDYAFNQESGAFKMMGPIFGKASPMGSLGSAKGVTKMGRLVAVYNNSNAVAFVASGPDSSVAASSALDGIPVPPNAYIILALGSDLYVEASSALCFGYEIMDDLDYNPNSGANS